LLSIPLYHYPSPPPVIDDQGDLDAHTSNPALHHPTKKAFCSDQALLDTAALLGSTFASLASAPLGGLLIVGAGQNGDAKNTPQGEITNYPNDDKYSSLLLSLIPPFIGNQGDLDAYISNPALCQPTKKAFRRSQALLVTAALFDSTSAPPPARISIDTNKRSALASAEKGGVYISGNVENAPQNSLKVPLEQVTKDRKSTYCAKKMVFGHSSDEQELLQETKEESCRLLMAPLDRFMDKETQADTAQENACASHMKIQGEQFKNTARQNCNLPGVNYTDKGSETTSNHSNNDANDDRVDNNGIYGGKNDDDDSNFTYHSSDWLDEDDEDGDEVLGNGADGTSPTMSTCGKDGQSFIEDSWTTCLIGCMKLKQITHIMHHFFLPPPSPKFFRASHARISTTPKHGFLFFCEIQAIPHGRCLTKTSAK
jgi:hypothetical protein